MAGSLTSSPVDDIAALKAERDEMRKALETLLSDRQEIMTIGELADGKQSPAELAREKARAVLAAYKGDENLPQRSKQ